MATNEQYEKGARNLIQRIRSAPNSAEKARVMTCLGNLRYRQYRTTQDPSAMRLARNCYLAARSFQAQQVTA